MEPQEIELKLYQIIIGTFYLKYQGKDYKLVSNTSEEIYKANLIYQEIMEDLKFDDLKSWKDALVISHHKKIWTFEQEKALEGLHEALKTNKHQYYNNFFNVNKSKKINKIINSLIKGINKSYTNKYYLYETTKDYYAEQVKDSFLIYMGIRDSEDNRVFKEADFFDTDSPLINLFKQVKDKNFINQDDIREIAKSEPWRTIWGCSKNALPFGINPWEWSTPQVTLVSLSRMYDNVYKSPDCPPDEIIADNHALDGWFISQHEERKNRQKEKDTESRFGAFNNNNDQEIFLMANEKGDVEDIYNMNDAQSRHIIETRSKVISEAGTIEHGDLPDVKMNMQMQAAQEFRQNMRKA